MHVLKIKILNDCPNIENVKKYYLEKANNIGYKNDSGVDLIFPTDVEFDTNAVKICNLGIACEFIANGDNESSAFTLEARSSISKTPLMLANSRGIIDAGYRGPICAALRCFIDRNFKSTMDDFKYVVKANDRLVQIVAPDMKPISIQVVDELSNTVRGDKGFGSTN